MPFDIEAAKKQGYSDSEIAEYLSKSRGFDLENARKSGYSDTEITSYLTQQDYSEPQESLTAGQVTKSAISNIPRSAAQFGKNVFQAVAHPFQTGEAMADILAGAIAKTVPDRFKKEEYLAGPRLPEQAATQFGEFWRQRYGGKENIKQTLAEDPVGASADLAALLYGGAGAARMAGLPKAGGIVQKTAQAVDPINITAKTVGGVGKGASALGKYALGISTGKGPANIATAAQGGRAFIDTLRGTKTGGEIVTGVRDALQVLKGKRAADYRPRLEALREIQTQSSITPIKNKLTELLYEYGIRTTKKGGLDFSRSTLNKAGAKDVTEIIELIRGWGKRAGDNTPIMLDTLKRRLDDFYSESNTSRAMVTALRNEVKNTLTKAVPEYKEMTALYEKTTGLINEMERGLSAGKRSSIDTSLRKLTSAMREEPDFRRSLIKLLDDMTETKLQQEIAGYTMRDIVPAGLWGKGLESAWAWKFFTTLDPTFAALIAAGSPRVVGEFLHQVGKGRNLATKMKQAAQRTGIGTVEQGATAFQVGRAAEELQKNIPGYEESLDERMRRFLGLGPRR